MERREHREAKWPFPFVEYAPCGLGDGAPLIIQLHGAGERGEGGDELSLVDVHGFSSLLEKQDFPARFIMPQCPKESFWAARVESILKFVEMLIEEYRADKSRVYLTGLSMGGFGTWYTAMAKPSLFAAIAPVCGGGMPWNAGVLDMPIWTFHGALDTTVLPSNTDQMVDKLRELSRDVKYTRLEGVAHNAWNYAYNAELVNWMLDKRRA